MLTKENYLKKVNNLNDPYWSKTVDARWKYMKEVIDELKVINPITALEIGTNKISCMSFSDTMELKLSQVDPDNLNNKIYIQDAKSKWKIEPKHYDVVVALQVFEHLGPKQSKVFSYIQKCSKYAILTIPYKWKCDPSDCHHNITDEIVNEWTNGYTPYKRELVYGSRLMLCYKFE